MQSFLGDTAVSGGKPHRPTMKKTLFIHDEEDWEIIKYIWGLGVNAAKKIQIDHETKRGR